MSEETYDAAQEIIDAISKDPPLGVDDQEIAAFVTKCVVVVEWIDENGNRWLTRRTLMADGRPGPAWDAAGLLFEALHGEWQENK